MLLGLLSRFPPAECGIAEYSYFLASALKKCGIDVVVFGNRDVPLGEDRGIDNEFIIERCFTSAAEDYDDILVHVKRYRPEILHVQHDYSFFPLSTRFLEFLEKLRSYGVKKIVVTMHTVLKPIGIILATEGRKTFTDGAREDFEIVMFQRKLGEIVDKIVVHSYLQEVELWTQGVNMEKIEVIPHGTLINPYIARSKRDLIEELNLDIDPKTFVIVCPGFIRRDKGLDIVVKAFRIVRQRFDAVLMLGGAVQGKDSGRLRDYLVDVVGKEHRDVVVFDRFLRRDDLLKILALSDVVVLPYREERGLIGVSGALHLALGSFKPLICTRVPRLVECCEVIPELCVKPDNPVEIAYKLMYVLEHYNDVRELMKPLWIYAEKTNWLNTARKHIELYKTLLG